MSTNSSVDSVNLTSTKGRLFFLMVGIPGMLFAVLGLLYNVGVLCILPGLPKYLEHEGLSFSHLAFFSMTLFASLFSLLLLLCGIEFLRFRKRAAWYLFLLLVSEVVYLALLNFLALIPSLGESIGPVFGLANGGMFLHFVVLFPLWGIGLAFIARRFDFRWENRGTVENQRK